MTNRKEPVLIVSSSFAPASQVGAKRFSFISAILHGQHFDFFTVTRDKCYSLYLDDSLPSGGTVTATAMFPAYPVRGENITRRIFRHIWERHLCLVDAFSGWYFPAVRAGLRVIRQHNIRVIIATGPPFISLVIGYSLSRITGAKLILDYRDPWPHYRRLDIPGRVGFSVNSRLEKRAIAHASAIVVSSEIMRRNFLESFPAYTHAPVHCITNGFHPAEQLEPIALSPEKKNLCYAGNFYGERRISLLLEPLLSLVKEGVVHRDEIRIHVFGRIKEEDWEAFRSKGIADWLREHPPVEHSQVLRYLRAADALILISGSDVSYALPFKLFDYLSVQKRIVAIASCESAVAHFMKNVDCGAWGDIQEPKSIRDALARVLDSNWPVSFRGAENYTWQRSASAYREVIESVLIRADRS